MLNVETRGDVWRLTAVITAFSLLVVTATLITLYPQDQWLWEMSVSWPLTTVLAGGASYLVARNMLRVSELNKELARLVSRDRLTNVATRDFFFSMMEQRPDAYGTSLMVDIDYFKRVNDTYGHLVGDKVISRVAHVLLNAVGPDDIVCRFGGEEFVVFLAEQDETEGVRQAEKLRALIADTPVQDDHTTVQVTVSIGGSIKAATENIEDAIQRADVALYEAKNGGRNQVRMNPIGKTARLAIRKTA